jgi:UDPglucose 6-dehydrogenase
MHVNFVILRTQYIAQNKEENMRKTIGIIGQGFVGSAIREGMQHAFNVETLDIDPAKPSTVENISELVDRADEVVFVCLPTPMKKNGRCDIRIVETAISDINDANKRLNKNIIAIIKSTVEPGTTDRLNSRYSNVTAIFNPEFLTEANSFNDFKNQSRIIVGGPRPASTIVKTMYRRAFPKVPIVKTGASVAETVKYFINCFLATKVSFANEMKQVCDKIDVDYDKVVEYALYDDRIGNSHLSVPGPDGSHGFGGHCFPKDLNAMMYIAKDYGIDPMVMTGVWEKNNEVRPRAARDWEMMVGRAVIDD